MTAITMTMIAITSVIASRVMLSTVVVVSIRVTVAACIRDRSIISVSLFCSGACFLLSLSYSQVLSLRQCDSDYVSIISIASLPVGILRTSDIMALVSVRILKRLDCIHNKSAIPKRLLIY